MTELSWPIKRGVRKQAEGEPSKREASFKQNLLGGWVEGRRGEKQKQKKTLVCYIAKKS